RSYSIYLWHWPVFMVTRPQLDLPIEGWPLLLLRLVATGALAELSYRCVERPIRTGALDRAWRALRESRGAQRWRLATRWAGVGGAGAALAAQLGVAVVQARPPAVPDYLPGDELQIEAQQPTPIFTVTPAAPPSATPGPDRVPKHSPTSAVTAAAEAQRGGEI